MTEIQCSVDVLERMVDGQTVTTFDTVCIQTPNSDDAKTSTDLTKVSPDNKMLDKIQNLWKDTVNDLANTSILKYVGKFYALKESIGADVYMYETKHDDKTTFVHLVYWCDSSKALNTNEPIDHLQVVIEDENYEIVFFHNNPARMIKGAQELFDDAKNIFEPLFGDVCDETFGEPNEK